MLLKFPVMPMFNLTKVITSFVHNTKPGFYFAGEMHNFWEVVYIKKGSATVSADERIYNLKAGQMIFHKPMEFHRIWCNDKPLTFLVLTFSAEGEGLNYFKNRTLSLNPDEELLFENLHKSFSKINSQKSIHNVNKEDANSACVNFLNFFTTLYNKDFVNTAVSSKNATYFKNIIICLNRHINEKITLSQIAKECLLSESNLKRIFRMYSDKGIIEYFNYIKIRKAIELIEAGEEIKNVSELLGFTTNSYFYNVFKKVTGTTPKSYKKSR